MTVFHRLAQTGCALKSPGSPVGAAPSALKGAPLVLWWWAEGEVEGVSGRLNGGGERKRERKRPVASGSPPSTPVVAAE